MNEVILIHVFIKSPFFPALFQTNYPVKDSSFHIAVVADKIRDAFAVIFAVGVLAVGAGAGGFKDILFGCKCDNLFFFKQGKGADKAYGEFPVFNKNRHGKQYSFGA